MSRIFVIVILFFSFIALIVISNNDLAFSNLKNVSIFFSIYFSWISNLYKNICTLTGNAISLDWFHNI